MKKYFTKPEHISKSFYWFFWFTIFAFIVGVVIKGIVAGWETYMMSVDIPHGKHLYDLAVAAGNIPAGSHNWTANYIEAGSGLGLQMLILILTVIIYPMSIWKQMKIVNGKEAFSKDVYRKLKIENIIFLVVFIVLDLMSIGIIVYEKAPMYGWVLFAVISIIIPTPLVITSLVWLRKLKLSGEVVIARKARV